MTDSESKCRHEVSLWNGRAEDYQRLDMHLQKPTFSLGRVGGVHFHRLRRTSHHDVKRC